MKRERGRKARRRVCSFCADKMADIDYKEIKSLRIEAVQKLELCRPVSVGQASRISGVSPADISVLLVWLEQHRVKKQ